MIEIKTGGYEPKDPDFETRVRESFAMQKAMETIGAELSAVLPGEVEIRLPFRGDLVQQHGYLHAGIVTAVVDSACGYSALTLLPRGIEVLTIEYKVNFLSPATGELMIARGRVIKSGRNVSICLGEVTAKSDAGEKTVAAMLATMMAVRE